ncbi:MAG: hypothetical protein ACI9MC_003848 [Kiritimatiellia bacterium]|jgi:hypothetical protein
MMRSLVVVLALAACGGNATPDTPQAPEIGEDGIELLTARRQLIRLSIDLRGTHPSQADLDFIQEYPDAYEEYADRYLHDRRFTKRMMEIWNRSFRTRTGETYFDPAEAGLEETSEDIVADSIGDEPLRLIAHVVDNDLPWSEVLTADYSMADPIVAAMWGLDYPEGAEGWQKVQYQDGRPLAGVLSSTTMWLKYPSAGINSNRHRANTVSRIFMCDDYLSRPVEFSRSQIDALVGGDPNELIAKTQLCQSCHSTLDPAGSHFYGFWWEVEGGLVDQTTYRPEDEPLWREITGTSPAFYGTPTSGLKEMAHHLAADERTLDCAVETVFNGITQRDRSDEDWDEVWTHRQAFADGGLTMRALVKSIVMSRTYRAGAIHDVTLGDRVPVLKTVTPAQLEGIVYDKTGYRWNIRGRAALDRNAIGLAVLAGGTDSVFVHEPNSDPSVGLVFVQERLAQAAAYHVASHDLAKDREDDAVLLRYVTRRDTPESNRDIFRVQIEQLYLEVTGNTLPIPVDTDGVEGEPPEVAELIVLWKQLHSVNANPEMAWAGVLSVVLRDPEVIFY